MPIISIHNSRRCSDPYLYSLKAKCTHGNQIRRIYLPPLLDTSYEAFFEKYHQFSDTSCQERSIMIDKLIDCSADIVDSIWSSNYSTQIMSTASFIREILKRKLILAANHGFVLCGRRMFLAALMAASKYLNDKNYRNKTWAKIASLPVAEINATELAFLKLIGYQLYVSKPLYDKWVSLLHEHIRRTGFIAVAKEKPGMNYYYYPPYTPPCLSSCTNSPDTSSTCTPVSNLQNTPPLVFDRKRSSSLSNYGDNNIRIIKHMRHV